MALFETERSRTLLGYVTTIGTVAALVTWAWLRIYGTEDTIAGHSSFGVILNLVALITLVLAGVAAVTIFVLTIGSVCANVYEQFDCWRSAGKAGPSYLDSFRDRRRNRRTNKELQEKLQKADRELAAANAVIEELRRGPQDTIGRASWHS